MTEKTQEENAKLLEELVAMDPDKKVDPWNMTLPAIKWDEDFMREVLGTLLTNLDLAKKHIKYIKPDHWITDPHRLIYRLLAAHVTKYHALPTRAWLMNEITQTLNDKDHSVQICHRAELSTIMDYYENHPAPAAIDAKLSEFIHKQTTALGMLKLNHAITNRKGTQEEIDRFILGIVDQRRVIRSGLQEQERRGRKLSELLEIADETFSWLIENWLAAGSIKHLSGRYKGGKTTLVLHALADAIYDGEVWNEKAVAGFPVVWLDFDCNPIHHITNTIEDVLVGRDQSVWDGYFSYFSRYFKEGEPGDLPAYLTVDFLKAATAQAEAENGGKKGVIVVDTLIAALCSIPGMPDKWYFDADLMRGIIAPFVEFIRQSGWSMILLHHTNQAGKVYGGIAIPAAVDTVDTFTRDMGATVAVLMTEGRLPNGEKKRKLAYEDKRYRCLGDAGEIHTAAKKSAKEETLFEKFLQFKAAVPITAGKRINQAELARRLKWHSTTVGRTWTKMQEYPDWVGAIRTEDLGCGIGVVFWQEVSPELLIVPASDEGQPDGKLAV